MTPARLSVLAVLCAAVLAAQTRGELPPRIAALVPQGTEISSQSFGGTPVMAAADFTAIKKTALGHSVEYRLELHAYDNNSPTWKMKESAYRRQMDAHIAAKRSSLAPESANQGTFTADPVKEKKNGWGTGLTQRLLHHPPQAKQYVDYAGAYFGMSGGITFELFVSGMPDDPAEADKWADDVAQAVSKLSVSNIGAR